MKGEILYFFNIDPSFIDNLTQREYIEIFETIKKLEKEHYFLASRTNPEYITGESNHIDTSSIQSVDEIQSRVNDYASKLSSLKSVSNVR